MDANELDRRLAAIEERIARLEGLASAGPHYSESVGERMARPPVPGAGMSPPPPPPIPHSAAASPPPPPRMGEPGQSRIPSPPSRRVRTAEEAEYQIGARVFPVVGAIATLGAIAYLVSLGLQRGVITPSMLFGAICLFCVLFIGLGLWKRNEKEEFGQILTGIGSCGLYLNFAAGHVYQNLYEGETLVTLFMGLSLLNLLYAAWRASKPFWAIGVLGGLSAALMPLHEDKVVLDVALQFAILMPAAAIVMRRRWPKSAIVMGAVGTIALIPAMLASREASVDAVVGGLLGTALIAIAAYAWTDLPVEWDPDRTFAPVAIFAASVLSLALRCTPRTGVEVLLAAFAMAGLGWSLSPKMASKAVLLGAAIVALVNVPYSLTMEQSAWTYIVLGLICAAASTRFFPKVASAFAGVELAAAAYCYLQLLSYGKYPPTKESAVLVGLMALTVAATYAARRTVRDRERLTLAALIVLGPMIVRFAFHSVFLPDSWRDVEYDVIAGMLSYTALVCGVVWLTRWRGALVLGWIVSGLTIYGYASTIALNASSATAFGVVMEVLMAVAVSVLLAASFASGSKDKEAEIIGIAVCVLGAFATRFGFLLLVAAGVPSVAATLASATLVALAAGAVGRFGRLSGVPWGAAFWWAIAGAGYCLAFVDETVLSVWDGWIGAGLLVSLALCCAAIQRRNEEDYVYWLTALAAWPVASHLGWLLLGPRGLGMNDNAAVTAAWIALALVLLSVGFLRDRMHLRLTSFLVIAATIAKVVLVDLANTDQAIKAVILILLGFVTLGGGYWYIRAKGVRAA